MYKERISSYNDLYSKVNVSTISKRLRESPVKFSNLSQKRITNIFTIVFSDKTTFVVILGLYIAKGLEHLNLIWNNVLARYQVMEWQYGHLQKV